LEKEPKDHFFSSRKEAKAFSFFDKEKQKERLGISPRATPKTNRTTKITPIIGGYFY
jgi:hypothetical protein